MVLEPERAFKEEVMVGAVFGEELADVFWC